MNAYLKSVAAKPVLFARAAVKGVRPMMLTALIVALPAYAASAQDARAPVAALYKAFAWQALSVDKVFGEALVDQPAATLSQYFDPTLTRLLADDAACQRRTQEICHLDFDILFDSQDPQVTDLTIAIATPNTVEVRFKDPVSDAETLITFTVAKQAQGWRISDVSYRKQSNKTLRKLLGQPLKKGSAP